MRIPGSSLDAPCSRAEPRSLALRETKSLFGGGPKFAVNKPALDRSLRAMQRTKVVVMWEEGLHLRLAAKLVRVAREFRSTIWLKCNGKVIVVQDILGVLTLCATMGTAILVEAVGDDEQDAAWAIAQLFSSASGDIVAAAS